MKNNMTTRDKALRYVDDERAKVPELPERDWDGGYFDSSSVWDRLFSEAAEKFGLTADEVKEFYNEREYWANHEEMMSMRDDMDFDDRAEARARMDGWETLEAYERRLAKTNERIRVKNSMHAEEMLLVF